MATVELRWVNKGFGATPELCDVSLAVADGEFLRLYCRVIATNGAALSADDASAAAAGADIDTDTDLARAG